jgi:hypothetical protein
MPALAHVKKTIYSLIDLREILLACNRRYLAYLSALDDFSAGVRALARLTKPRDVEGKTVRGINFFDAVDNALLTACKTPGSISLDCAPQGGRGWQAHDRPQTSQALS